MLLAQLYIYILLLAYEIKSVGCKMNKSTNEFEFGILDVYLIISFHILFCILFHIFSSYIYLIYMR